MGSILRDSDRQGCGGRIGSSKWRGRVGASPVIFTAGMVILAAQNTIQCNRVLKANEMRRDPCQQPGGDKCSETLFLGQMMSRRTSCCMSWVAEHIRIRN
eukprot:scaffold34597_cov177-Amphora_coffeaeformis.AAC.25